jgi:flagellar hook-associated protein 1 FlgK
MASLFTIGRTALQAFRTNLSVTGQNIANVDTPGYSRQRAELSSRVSAQGVSATGSGVQVDTVRRLFDQFINSQVLQSTSSFNRADNLLDLSSRVESLLGEDATGMQTALSTFFESVQTVASNPTAIANRQVMLSDSQQMVDRYNFLNREFVSLRQGANQQVEGFVREINTLSSALADVNKRIFDLDLNANPANELFDQRDQLVRELGELADVTAVEAEDGTVTVNIATGTPLVIGDRSFELAADALGEDPQDIDVGVVTPNAVVPISDQISGGKLAGALQFRDSVLARAQAELGLEAIGLAEAYNLQHRQGLDLDGNIGGDLFSLTAPDVVQNDSNSQFGTDAINVQFADVQQLQAAEYRLEFDGVNWSLRNNFTDQNVALTATGPNTFEADGMAITVDPAAQAGDNYTLRPTRNGARDISLLIDNPREIAAAATQTVNPLESNTGSVTAEVRVDYEPPSLGPSDPNFFDDFRIEFSTGPDTYQILDTGGAVLQGPTAYTAGTPFTINFNGVAVDVEGTPGNGDELTIQSNMGAVGDNANALAMGELQQAQIFANGTATIEEAYQSFLGEVATQTRQTRVAAAAQEGLLNNAVGRREAVSGVNLDEEAANLQRLQQYYQASAQIISVADDIFQTLIGAVSR